jgi:hypothetical protein
MNSTARRWESGLGCKLARRREAGWGGVTTEARQAWLASVGSLEVPVDAWPEGALCDPELSPTDFIELTNVVSQMTSAQSSNTK